MNAKTPRAAVFICLIFLFWGAAYGKKNARRKPVRAKPEKIFRASIAEYETTKSAVIAFAYLPESTKFIKKKERLTLKTNYQKLHKDLKQLTWPRESVFTDSKNFKDHYPRSNFREMYFQAIRKFAAKSEKMSHRKKIIEFEKTRKALDTQRKKHLSDCLKNFITAESKPALTKLAEELRTDTVFKVIIERIGSVNLHTIFAYHEKKLFIFKRPLTQHQQIPGFIEDFVTQFREKRLSLTGIEYTAAEKEAMKKFGLIKIAAGIAVIRDTRNNAARRIFIPPFLMGAREISRRDFQEYCSAVKKKPPAQWKTDDADQYPAGEVSYYDAMDYCRYMSKKHGLSFRLPYETEWEYAASAGNSGSLYPWGNDSPEKRAACFYTEGRLPRLGAFFPNTFGLYDVIGGVWEWCMDAYVFGYPHTSDGQFSRIGPAEGPYRVLRGGAYNSRAETLRLNYRRGFTPPDYKSASTGFRVVVELPLNTKQPLK